MASKEVLAPKDREKLIEMIKENPKFREELKTNWAAAVKKAGIDPKDLKGKVLEHKSTVPYDGGPVQAGISIEIVISASAREEKINVNELVVFDQTKTKG